jgi:hypothetical protein
MARGREGGGGLYIRGRGLVCIYIHPKKFSKFLKTSLTSYANPYITQLE